MDEKTEREEAEELLKEALQALPIDGEMAAVLIQAAQVKATLYMAKQVERMRDAYALVHQY